MFLMVILRNVVKIETFDFSALAKVRQGTVPGLEWDKDATASIEGMYGAWNNAILESTTINKNLDEFYKYAQYPSPEYIGNETNGYDMEFDPLSPLYFAPSDCMKHNSF